MATDAILLDHAWSALKQAWAFRWGVIFLLGSGLPVIARLVPAMRRWPHFGMARRVGALIACCLALYSGYLLQDTVMVDDQGVSALVKERCAAPCDLVPGGQAADVWRLPYTGEPVYFEPVLPSKQ